MRGCGDATRVASRLMYRKLAVLVLLSVVLDVGGDATPYPGAHRGGVGHFLQELRAGIPMYNDYVQSIDASEALMALVRTPTPLDSVWGEKPRSPRALQHSELRQGVVRTLALACVVGVLVGATVGAIGMLHWSKRTHPVLDAIAGCDCGYQNDADYRNDCPGLLLFGLFLLLLVGLCTVVIGTISCSNALVEFPRALAMLEDAAVFTMSYTHNLKLVLEKFLGNAADGKERQMGLLGERSISLRTSFLGAKFDIDNQREAMGADLKALQQLFQDFEDDQWVYFPSTNQYSARASVSKMATLARVLDRVASLEMSFPNSGEQVFAISNKTLHAGYQNIQHLLNITAPQLSDVRRMRSATLLYWHRAITIALQVYFGLAAFVCLIVSANTMLRDENAWIAAYLLVALNCLSAWCLLGAVFPEAVVIDAVCKNLNETAGHIASPLLNTLLTRSNESHALSNARLLSLSQRMSTHCLDPSADDTNASLFNVLALDRELISSVFSQLRLDEQFDTKLVLALSYQDYADVARPTSEEISDIRGLKDMLIPKDSSSPPCPDFSTGVCLQKASECSQFQYADASSSFIFNCTQKACLEGSCNDCERSCKCCNMMSQLQNIQSKAAALVTAITRLETSVKELQSDLTFEMNLQESDSFHSLLTETEKYFYQLDQSCKTPNGISALYGGLRHEVCHNLQIDQDIQWFGVGLLAVIFSPWLPLLILMVRTRFPDKYARSGEMIPTSTSSPADVDAQLTHDVSTYQEFMATGGQLLTSPPVTGPAAAQALRSALPQQSVLLVHNSTAGSALRPSPMPENLGLTHLDVADSPYVQIWQDDDLLSLDQGPHDVGALSSSVAFTDITAQVRELRVEAHGGAGAGDWEKAQSVDSRPKQVDLDR